MKKYYLKMVYTDTYISLVNNMEIKKDGLKNSRSENIYRLDREVDEPGNSVLHYLQVGPDRLFVREEWIHISEDT